MKRILVVSLLAITLVLPGIASANLIVGGDFTGLPAGSFTSFSGFSGNTGPFGQWLGQTNTWAIETSGGPDGSEYARQLFNTSRLYQGFDASGIASGTSMNISLYYIYEAGYTYASEESIWVYGFKTTDSMSEFAPWAFTGTPVLLYQHALSIQTEWTNLIDSFTVTGDYSALLFMVGMGDDSNPSALRGVDKINIDVAAVPEPSTLLLLGSGLLGLVGFGRKKFKK